MCVLWGGGPQNSRLSSIVSSIEFCELLCSLRTDDLGRARLLDGAAAPGPSSWLARVPCSPTFRFLEAATDPISAKAADLLACPPHLLGCLCTPCTHRTGLPTPHGADGRHFVNCPRGLRLHCAVSDRVRDVLVDLLVAAGLNVIAERPGSHRQMTTFRAAEGLALLKSPDLALVGFDGPGSFTLIDVKVVDPAAPSYCSRLTGREALGRHRELERAGPLDYFGPGRSPPPGPACVL